MYTSLRFGLKPIYCINWVVAMVICMRANDNAAIVFSCQFLPKDTFV